HVRSVCISAKVTDALPDYAPHTWFTKSISGEDFHQLVQARAGFVPHGCELDAHSFAALTVAHQSPSAHFASRNFEKQLDGISVRRRLRGCNKQSSQRQHTDS